MGKFERGKVQGGSILFSRPIGLPEGTEVRVFIEPIAPNGLENPGRKALLERMEAEGMIEHVPPPAESPPDDWRPLVLKGEPLSETIIKMRR